MIKPTITATQSKAARAALGISQSKVAGATGINRSQLALFEVKKLLLPDAKLEALRTYYEGLGYAFEAQIKTVSAELQAATPTEPQSSLGDTKIIDRFLVPAGVEDDALEPLLAEIDSNDQKIDELAQQRVKFDWFGTPDLAVSQEVMRLMARNYARVRQLQRGIEDESGEAVTAISDAATVGDLVGQELGVRLSH